jgi:hypothetical protein
MRHLIFDLATLTLVALSNCVAADNDGRIAIGPIKTVNAEPGVVPPGTSFVVHVEDGVKTNQAEWRRTHPEGVTG